MTLTAQHALSIDALNTKNPTSKVRKQFNTLIKKLDAARARLAEWEETIPIVARRAQEEFHPLAESLTAQQKELALLFDRMHQHKLMGKRDKAKLEDLICSLAADVLAQFEDAELEEVFNRHSGTNLDAEFDATETSLKDMLASLFGAELAEEDEPLTPEAMMEQLAERRQHGEHDKRADEARAAKSATRPKSASTIAREEREAVEANKLKQTVRDIFRKLVSELHPDRESDEAERARKTALMQRVNIAYAANDLLGLLGLQLEIEQIDQAHLNQMNDDRVKQFNKILEGQLRELEREIIGFEHAVSIEFGGDIRERPSPKMLLQCLQQDIKQIQGKIKSITADLEEFRDVRKLKAWLKTYRPVPVSHFDDDWF